jgi:hypothetical protein
MAQRRGLKAHKSNGIPKHPSLPRRRRGKSPIGAFSAALAAAKQGKVEWNKTPKSAKVPKLLLLFLLFTYQQHHTARIYIYPKITQTPPFV